MKLFWITSIFLAMAASAVARQQVPLATGSGGGSLTFPSGFYSDGFIENSGTFDPEGSNVAESTVWRNDFMIHNVTDGTTHWVEEDGGGHAPVLPDGLVISTSAGFTNTGINLGNGLTCNLSVGLSRPASGDTARVRWTWTFNNGNAGAAKTVRIVWYLDGDSYHAGSNYNDDVIVRLNNGFAGSGYALAMGEGVANANVNGALGILAETSVPAIVLGVAETSASGSHSYWENSGNFIDAGPEVQHNIQSSIANIVQNDNDNNGVSDLVADVGAAFQVELDIAAGGTESITFRATWGNNVTYTGLAGVGDWTLY